MIDSIETDLAKASDVAIALTSCALGVPLIDGKSPLVSIVMVTAFTIHLDSVAADISLPWTDKEIIVCVEMIVNP